MDIVWGYRHQPLPLLSKIAFAVLTNHQSNAAEGEGERERVFSVISKHKTVFLPNLYSSNCYKGEHL